MQDFGFDLEETRPFVECLRAGHPEGDSCPASLAVYRRKLDELDGLIGELQAVRAKIGLRSGDGRGGTTVVRTGRAGTVIKAAGVAEVTDADFEAEVIGAELPVLVEFTADWCAAVPADGAGADRRRRRGAATG